MEHPGRAGKSFQLDVGRSDYLGPLLSFVGNELAKLRGRHRHASPPRSASRSLILGSASPAVISLLSLLTISAGISFGAKPCLDEVLKSWPVDKSVGNVRNKGPQLIHPVSPALFDELT